MTNFVYRSHGIKEPTGRIVTGILIEPDKIVAVAPHYTAPIIFECHAEDITQADRMMEAVIQINPVKRPDISCTLSPYVDN